MARAKMCIYKLIKHIFLLLVSIAFVGCSPSTSQYEADIQHWHQSRINYLKSEDGFLNLAGLYWLKEGVNTFGSNNTNNIYFTDKSLPNMGAFLLKDSLVYLITKNQIYIDGNIVTDTTLVFGLGEAKQMRYESLLWFIIKRGDKVGIRLRDLESSLLEEFDFIDYFKTNPDWKLEARWKPYKEWKEVPFTNVLGISIKHQVKGAFYFKIEGAEYKLEPLGNPGEHGYFIMFYDKTSAHTTYGSGRYIYVQKPDINGLTYIDFNKAFNPPCVFTEFATCLFPHKENRLPIFVNVGEKFSSH